MPHSPYTYSETIYPPISDLTQYKQDLVYHRVSIENFARDDEREDALLDIGDNLLKHCEFLEGKLNIKVMLWRGLCRLMDMSLHTAQKTQYNQLVEKSDNFKQRVDTLTTENQGLKTEIADLKSKLEKLEKEAATKVHEQDSANGVQVDR